MTFKDKFREFQPLTVNNILILRQIKPEQDLAEHVKIYNDADVFRYYEGYKNTQYDDERVLHILHNRTRAFDRMSEYTWTITDAETDCALGRIHLSDFQNNNTAANIGYFLGREHWGKGIISACIATVAAFGFNYMNLQRIFTTVEVNNIGSWRALAKNGFTREGTLRRAMSLPDGLHDCYLYAKLSTD